MICFNVENQGRGRFGDYLVPSHQRMPTAQGPKFGLATLISVQSLTIDSKHMNLVMSSLIPSMKGTWPLVQVFIVTNKNLLQY